MIFIEVLQLDTKIKYQNQEIEQLTTESQIRNKEIEKLNQRCQQTETRFEEIFEQAAKLKVIIMFIQSLISMFICTYR